MCRLALCNYRMVIGDYTSTFGVGMAHTIEECDFACAQLGIGRVRRPNTTIARKEASASSRGSIAVSLSVIPQQTLATVEPAVPARYDSPDAYCRGRESIATLTTTAIESGQNAKRAAMEDVRELVALGYSDLTVIMCVGSNAREDSERTSSMPDFSSWGRSLPMPSSATTRWKW